MKYTFSLVLLLFGFFSFAQSELLKNHLDGDFYQTQMTGFYLYDPIEKKELFNYNGQKYFTPASNTKIFTLYAAIKTLSDSIPAFRYNLVNDVLHIQGTGDPTFLHPKFNNHKVLDFLKNNGNKIVLHWNNFDEDPFMPGWSWDDFRKSYSPERSQFPIHENLVSISKNGKKINTFPSLFQNVTFIRDYSEAREFYENKFYISSKNSTLKVPFITKDNVVKAILEELLEKPVEISYQTFSKPYQTLYSISSERIYKEMMEESDNFLAEQLLIVSSSTLDDKLNSIKIIDFIKSKYLSDLKQKPEWIDGSGLSRYNMITPHNLVQVLDKLYKENETNRLFNIFPVGGESGTIKNRYKDSKQPYLFAKTGTLGNVLTLSGYVKTKSDKILIFSLMNNNVNKTPSLVRNENEKLIKLVRDNY